MISPEVSSFGFPLGEIGETLAISEELGTVASVVMWLKGAVANSAYNLLCETLSLRLDGDYRWTPPSRLSPGEARLASRDSRLTWMHARCLKAVADDIERPPHAVEYILDYRMGPPGLKFFRCICAFKEGGRWMVVPCLKPPVPLAFEEGAPSGLRQSPASFAALLAYREPWSSGWVVVDSTTVDSNYAIAHAITWADFQLELTSGSLTPEIVRGIRTGLQHSALRITTAAAPPLERRLLTPARDILLWLRGIN
jgi:hypothetical protein